MVRSGCTRPSPHHCLCKIPDSDNCVNVFVQALASRGRKTRRSRWSPTRRARSGSGTRRGLGRGWRRAGGAQATRPAPGRARTAAGPRSSTIWAPRAFYNTVTSGHWGLCNLMLCADSPRYNKTQRNDHRCVSYELAWIFIKPNILYNIIRIFSFACTFFSSPYQTPNTIISRLNIKSYIVFQLLLECTSVSKSDNKNGNKMWVSNY